MIWQEANKRFVTAYSAQDTSAGALSIIDYADFATNRLLVGTSTDNASTIAISCLDSTMTAASSKFITLGQANSTYNQAEISFYYAGSGLATNRLDLGLNGGTKMTILPNGNVGIGQQTPLYALDVSGSLRVTGSITGTIQTASQPNITSVGRLSSLNIGSATTVSSTVNINGSINVGDNIYMNIGYYAPLYILTTNYTSC